MFIHFLYVPAVTHSKNSIMKEFVKSQRNSQASKNFRKVNNNHYEHPFRQNHPIHQQSNQFSVPPPRINSNSNMAVQYDKPFSSQVQSLLNESNQHNKFEKFTTSRWYSLKPIH